jgi:hypothetical protein
MPPAAQIGRPACSDRSRLPRHLRVCFNTAVMPDPVITSHEIIVALGERY